jgi:TetR/AcrR family transcriptional repressor of nem operon
MPRPPEYERSEVLHQAMEVFWRRGYNATSVKDLTSATGLQPGSLYGAFESKRSLFLETLETYYELNMAGLDERLCRDKSPADRIRSVFEHIIEASTQDPDNKGCMMVNTLLEAPADDFEINDRLREMFESVENKLKDVITEAQEDHQISPDKDPEVLARSLLVGMHGIRVSCKSRPDPLMLRTSVDTLLQSILPGQV